MDVTDRVLFISAPIGSGHVRAAQAVETALRKMDPSVHTQIVNVFDFFSPTLGKTILRFYLKILKVFPRAYGMAYGWGNSSRIALQGREIISRYLSHRMQKFIDQYQPSVIVCSHATPAGLIAYLIRQGKLHTPSVAIVTDYVVHRLWVYPEITQYYVAHDDLRNYLAGYGIVGERTFSFGIPIAPQFKQNFDKRQLFDTLGLDAGKKTILIMGGGAGTLPLDEIVYACNSIECSIQLVVIAGHNKSMHQRIFKLIPTLNKKIKLYGFTENVHELMRISDILVSKPGGVTVAEAMAVGIPMIIYQPIPGQEEANTNYLIKHGAACKADTITDLVNILIGLLDEANPLMATLKANASVLGKPAAAEKVAAGILKIMRRVRDG